MFTCFLLSKTLQYSWRNLWLLGLLIFCCLSSYIYMLKVLDHMIYVSPPSLGPGRELKQRRRLSVSERRGRDAWLGGSERWGTGVHWSSSQLLHSSVPTELEMGTELSDTQNCKHILEIWIFVCGLPIFKSWLNMIKY